MVLGTIQILRNHVLGDFLTLCVVLICIQKWPVSEPTHPVHCLRNIWMAPYRNIIAQSLAFFKIKLWLKSRKNNNFKKYIGPKIFYVKKKNNDPLWPDVVVTVAAVVVAGSFSSLPVQPRQMATTGSLLS